MSQTIQRMSASQNILQPFSPQQLAQNDAASRALQQIGKRFRQQIFSTTVVPVYGSQMVVNVPIQPVGLITKFFAEVTTTITNPSAGSTLTRSSTGPFSQLSLISYTDPATNNRISTPGWHLAMVTARRHRRTPGAANTTDSPSGFGSVIQPIAAPATIAANASGVARTVYEIPLSVARGSTKGCVFAGAVFSTQSLQLTLNANLCQNGTDPLGTGGSGAVYTGAANANPPTYSTVITVWQEYWDQFPLALLPALSPDLSTIYEIKQTALSPLVAAVDNYVRFSNLREFWSVVLGFDNGGTMSAGTDINYFLLQSANQTTEWKVDPYLHSYLTRNNYAGDLPAGFYLFDFSHDPIITASEGNTVLSLNPSTVNANGVVYVGWEDIAVSSVLASAPSLSGIGGASG